LETYLVCAKGKITHIQPPRKSVVLFLEPLNKQLAAVLSRNAKTPPAHRQHVRLGEALEKPPRWWQSEMVEMGDGK